MEAKKLDALIEIDADGRVHADPEVLSRLTNQTFRVSSDGPTLTLRPGTRRLHEIEDPKERAQAYQEFKRQVTRPGGTSLPADWATIRDSLYD
ncbi:hypothetical protein [Deinococcus yunweiensis]|uniref:hypothetical protein n=1 Tax=Deinococcus yunweiensis TaxID=367282 RepID=UPI00398E6848